MVVTPRIRMMVPLAVLLATAACGTRPGTSGSPAPRTAVATPATATTDASHLPAGAPGEDPGRATKPTAAQVYLAGPAGPLRLDRPLSVAVVNGLSRTIYVDDSKTDCSILTLQQRSTTQSWVDVQACQQQRPPRVVTVGAGFARTITLQLTGANFQNPDAPPTLQAGDYRLTVEYRFTQDAVPISTVSTARSQPFHLS